jgi:hypothetical protein
MITHKSKRCTLRRAKKKSKWLKKQGKMDRKYEIEGNEQRKSHIEICQTTD